VPALEIRHARRPEARILARLAHFAHLHRFGFGASAFYSPHERAEWRFAGFSALDPVTDGILADACKFSSDFEIIAVFDVGQEFLDGIGVPDGGWPSGVWGDVGVGDVGRELL
jgi:hypothetical protein